MFRSLEENRENFFEKIEGLSEENRMVRSAWLRFNGLSDERIESWTYFVNSYACTLPLEKKSENHSEDSMA